MFQGYRISTIYHFQRDRRGAILPMAAVTLLIMFMLAGLAIDVAMIISAKNRIRRTMDAAGIAIATQFRDQTPTQEQVENFTISWVESNYPEYKIGEYLNLNVAWNDGQADLSAKVKVDTIFMDLFGATEIDANVNVGVISETRGLEVVLALDNSGSMAGTEIIALRSSVDSFIDILYENATDPSSIKIGMVPFVAAVNIKDPAEFASWIDPFDDENVKILDDNIDATEPAVPYHGEIYTPRTSHAYLYKQLATAAGKEHWHDAWRGCVEARAIKDASGEELDLTDVEPDTTDAKTLWVPYFWPDEPDNTVATGGDKDNDPVLITSDSALPTMITSGENVGEMRARNNYIADLLLDTEVSSDPQIAFVDRISSIKKYTDSANAIDAVKKSKDSPSITRGPGKSCPYPITPLTSDYAALKKKVDQEDPNYWDYLMPWNEGGTNIAQGLVWAWRVLSPAPPFTQGADYKDADGNINKKVEKVIVIFLDGGNGIVYQPNPFYSDYSAYSYVVPDGRLDPAPPAGTNDLDSKVLKLCANARKPAEGTSKEKLTIYAIGLGISSGDPAVGILEQCTGDPDRVLLAADVTTLRQKFESLAKDLTKLRVVY